MGNFADDGIKTPSHFLSHCHPERARTKKQNSNYYPTPPRPTLQPSKSSSNPGPTVIAVPLASHAASSSGVRTPLSLAPSAPNVSCPR